MGTTFIGETEGVLDTRTDSAQVLGVSTPKMKFPLIVPFRKFTATIYGKSAAYPFYRMAVTVAGKRIVRSFRTFTEAKREAKAKMRQMAKGNVAAGLSAKESADAMAIREAIAAFYRDTGRKLSAIEVVTTCLDSLRLLPPNVPLGEAVRTFCQSIATVQRKPLAVAVKEFCDARRPKGVSVDGKRSVLSSVYVQDTERQLNEFVTTNSGADVCDLTKQHLDLFLEAHAKLSPKSRNHYRATLRMFFGWCQRRDYLAATNRLLEADGLRKEDAHAGDVEIYAPNELRLLLDNANDELCVIIVLQAFGGLRLQEALRLDWRDVWSIKGHIEISSAKAKTRSRRLVDINSTLAAWLKPHRDKKEGAVTTMTLDAATWQLIQLRKRLKVPSKKNGFRHGFLSAHFAIHQNEGMTAAQAGTSPQMLFKHYRGLMTSKTAKAWFAVMPTKPE